MKDKEILDQALTKVEKSFQECVMRIPKRSEPSPFTPYWLHLEIVERYRVLLKAHIERGSVTVEIGSGPFAMSTTVLAYLAGEKGRVCAVEKGRWRGFEEVLQATKLRARVMPLWCDALNLPLKSLSCDTAVVVHGIRSLRNKETIIQILKEMFRVAPRIFVAESLPIVKNNAQRAHIEMYNLREEIFEAASGRKDDIHYLPLESLVELVECAGGSVSDAEILDVNLPHYLAFTPREELERIKDREKKEILVRKWEKAYDNLKKYGEEQPPVGIVRAVNR